jgi:TonB-dependent receptor
MTPTRYPKLRVPASVNHRKLGALCSAAAMAAVLGLSSAQAQTVAPAKAAVAATDKAASTEAVVTLDTFVVSGIRASMTKAIDIKRVTMANSVDSIVAEDISKFPDNNVVEALQRMPGIQVTSRFRGEVSELSVRGLSDLSTTVNGRNIFTASGTAVALQDIPATLIREVDVYKTRSADLLENGIAGVIDVKTSRPFDFKGDKVVLAARGIYQDLSKKSGPNYSGLYSKQWKTDAGKFGALINLSWAKTPYRDENVTAGAAFPYFTGTPPAGFDPYSKIPNSGSDGKVIWEAGTITGLPTAASSTLKVNGANVPYVMTRDAFIMVDTTGVRERPAANVSLQFAPNDSSEYTFEAFYNGYRNENFNNLQFTFVDWWGLLGTNPSANITLYPGTNIVKSRKDIGNAYMFMSGDLSTGKTDSYLYSLGGKWKINSDLNLKSDLAYQNSEFNSTFFAMRTERWPNIVKSVDFNSGGGLPSIVIGDDPATATVKENDLADTKQFYVAQLYDNANRNKGDALTYTADGDLKTNWGFIKSLKFGLRYDDRKASEANRTQSADGLGQPISNYPGLAFINSGFYDGESVVPHTWVAANGYFIRDNADAFRTIYNNAGKGVGGNLLLSNQLVLKETFHVKEVNTAAYIRADFETNIDGKRLDGQFGVRYVNVGTDMTFGSKSASASVTKLLPSMMVRYSLTDDLRFRLAYGETLRRPGFGSLNPTINYVKDVTNIGYGTASGGNPNLKPTQSKNYDLSVEYYFGKSSAVYATAFKRNIEGLVIDYRKRVTAIVSPATTPYDYILAQPDNASNGKLDGAEVGVVYFPDNLPDVLQGLGVQFSYTRLNSSQDIPLLDAAGKKTGTLTTPFFGVSDSSYNATLAYEKKKFGARLAYVWRSDFQYDNDAALFANPLARWRNAERSLDFQMSYKITKDFEVTLDATNLTGEVYQSYYANKLLNYGSIVVSRTVSVGARFAF